ncbi:MAG TPA: LytTR family DNA-binding domain-containing protein [Gemmatimonadaceae bacterium]|nr:LytTR family DNA-binding domain-containing protein [Gemmatimonadaceae bacterium]
MSDRLRILLVDDEPPARRRLRRMLAAEPDVEVVGDCATGAEAIAAVDEHAPHVVLLDIQMPDGDGLDVAASIGGAARPLIIFITAYNEYAVRAFETAALDYLVKPVGRARLRTALARAREQVSLRTSRDLPPATEPGSAADRFLVDRGHHQDVLRVDDIDWIEAADNHVIVHVGGERHRFRRTMEQMVERLPADRFGRVHRSAIVNVERVRHVHPWFHGTYLLVLADGTKLTTGRQYQARIMERLHLLR